MGSAYYRQVASRLLGRFPEIAEPLRDGRLCVSNVPQLAKVMTEENRTTVVAKFFHCSKQEARQVVAEILPAEVVPTRTVVTVVAPVKPAAAIVQPVGRDQPLPERGQARSRGAEDRGRAAHPDGDPDARHGVAGVRGPLEEGQGRSVPRPAGGDRRAGAHRGAGVAHRPAGEAAGQRAPEGEAGGQEARRGQVHVAAWRMAAPAARRFAPRSTTSFPAEGAARRRSTTAGSSATSTTGKPRARSTATRTWTCSLHVLPRASEPVAEWAGGVSRTSCRSSGPWRSRHILPADASIRTRGLGTPTRNRRAP